MFHKIRLKRGVKLSIGCKCGRMAPVRPGRSMVLRKVVQFGSSLRDLYAILLGPFRTCLDVRTVICQASILWILWIPYYRMYTRFRTSNCNSTLVSTHCARYLGQWFYFDMATLYLFNHHEDWILISLSV